MIRKTWMPALLLATGALMNGSTSIAALAQAQELRIGFIAPMTGIFSQLGTDKVNGFRMYLDEHKGLSLQFPQCLSGE